MYTYIYAIYYLAFSKHLHLVLYNFVKNKFLLIFQMLLDNKFSLTGSLVI